MLLDRYHQRVDDLLKEVRETQRENIIKAGKLIADTIANGGGVFLSKVCHSIENDLIYRGGGPIFYKHYKEEDHKDTLKAGDVLIALTTSGNSVNVLHACDVAKAKGMKVIGLTGRDGGRLKDKCDCCIIVPSNVTADIQEYHLPIYHTLCAMLEEHFFEN